MATKKDTEETPLPQAEETQQQAQEQANAPEAAASEVETPVILTASTREELNTKVEEFIAATPGAVAGIIGYDQMARLYSIRIDIIN